MVKIINADCLEVLKAWDGEELDLVYIDPPFNSGRDYGEFNDRWNRAGDDMEEFTFLMPGFVEAMRSLKVNTPMLNYLATVGIRCWYMRKLLKDTGSFYYHCDDTIGHYIKILLDYIFGIENFRNEIVWYYKNSGFKAKSKKFHNVNDKIFFYVKTSNFKFNNLRIPIEEGNVKKQAKRKFNPVTKKADVVRDESGKPLYIESKDKLVNNVWEIPMLNTGSERLGYPTQKPEALLERIIKASSNPGDLVGDFFLGSGTTGAAALKLGRRFIGCDVSPEAVRIAMNRIGAIQKQLGA